MSIEELRWYKCSACKLAAPGCNAVVLCEVCHNNDTITQKRIVAWMRNQNGISVYEEWMHRLADAIERGEWRGK